MSIHNVSLTESAIKARNWAICAEMTVVEKKFAAREISSEEYFQQHDKLVDELAALPGFLDD